MGNGAEKTLLASKTKMELCITTSAVKRAECIEKAILDSVFNENSFDETLSTSNSTRDYKIQWNLLSQLISKDFSKNYDGNNNVFVINCPSIMGGLQKVFNYQHCKQDKCAVLFNSVADLMEAAQIASEKYVSTISTVNGKLDIVITDSKRLDEQFQNSYLAMVAQLKAILTTFHYDQRVLVYNFGSWTEGAVFLMEKGLISGTFDPYVIMNTNEEEDKDYIIRTDAH